jgi:hypothetical protein
MSYLSELQAFYPKSWKQRLAIQQYDGFQEWEDKEPITVTVHQVIQRYGGPEEGGWWFNQGFPERTYCIFSKKQAVKTFLEVCEEYGVWDQPSLGLSTTDYNWEVSFASTAAKHYPEKRPHYC